MLPVLPSSIQALTMLRPPNSFHLALPFFSFARSVRSVTGLHFAPEPMKSFLISDENGTVNRVEKFTVGSKSLFLSVISSTLSPRDDFAARTRANPGIRYLHIIGFEVSRSLRVPRTIPTLDPFARNRRKSFDDLSTTFRRPFL